MNEMTMRGAVPGYRIEGFIGEDGATAAAVAEFLSDAGGAPVHVIVNSAGGSAFEGAAIYAELRAYGGEVRVSVRGIAASAASLIAMGGDDVEIDPAAMMMIHDPSAMTIGPAADHRQSADVLDRLGGTYATAYAARTGLPVTRIREMMLAETWLDADEAVALGFADAVADDGAAEPVAAFPYERFTHAPGHLVALAHEKGWHVAGREAGLSKKGQHMTSTTKTATAAPTITADKPGAPEAKPASGAATAKAVAAERTRAKGIRTAVAAAKFAPTMADELIDEGVSLEAASARIIEAMADAGDRHEYEPRATVGASWDGGEGWRAKMVDALTARLDPKHEPTAGREHARMSLGDLALAAARQRGLRPFNEVEAVRMAAHTTSDFPIILENSLTNIVARKFAQAMPATARVSRPVERVDYRTGKALTLSASGMPAEINEGGEIKFVTMDEKGEALPAPRDFGAGFNLTNKALVNDRTDLLQNAAGRMVQGAVERFRAVLLEPIVANAGAGQVMADGKTMFHADHGNLAGTGAALSIATLSAARQAMRTQKGLQGELYAVEPAFIYVPAALETAAQQLVAQITAAKFSDANPFSGSLEVVVEPGLDAHDDGGWYVVGDPARFDGHAHAFLDGQHAPRVETREAWSTLGMEFRLVWALDAKFIEPAAWYRNPGA